MRKMTIFASKTQFFPESGSRKHFQDSGMRTIDSPHKITSYGVVFEKILRKFFDFRPRSMGYRAEVSPKISILTKHWTKIFSLVDESSSSNTSSS
jgi:hypothetical protein